MSGGYDPDKGHWVSDDIASPLPPMPPWPLEGTIMGQSNYPHDFEPPPPQAGILTWSCTFCGKSTYNPGEKGECAVRRDRAIEEMAESVCKVQETTDTAGGWNEGRISPEQRSAAPAKDGAMSHPILDLGCGPAKFSGTVGLDRYPFPGVNVVRDVLRGLPWGASTFAAVHAKHILEHFSGEDLIFVVEEMWRVTVPGGRLYVVVPDATSPNRYRDPTHLTRDWSADSFMFWEVDDQGKYRIFRGPAYEIKAQLRVLRTAVSAGGDRHYEIEVVK